MIKLKFKIESYYWNDDYLQKCVYYNITKEYHKNTKFKDVLIELYNEYGISNSKKYNYFIQDLNKIMWQHFFKEFVCYYIDYELEDYEN